MKLLNESRDRIFVYVSMALSVLFIPWALSFYLAGSGWSLARAIPYWVAMIACLGPYTLMLHATVHRPLFQPKLKLLNQYIPWVLGPLFGQSPGTYFAHHVGMHHPESNGPDDLSSTMAYRRDSFRGFLHYWLKFLVRGAIDLAFYFNREKRKDLMRSVILGESLFWISVALLLTVNAQATWVVLLGPLLLCRFLLMAGNWAQHAFVNPAKLASPYGYSTTCDKTFYNTITYNDGYHAIHHLMPRCHYTDMPKAFERKKAEHLANGAIIFEGLDWFMIWALLMLKRYDVLARRLVPLREGETIDQRIARMRALVLPIPAASRWRKPETQPQLAEAEA